LQQTAENLAAFGAAVLECVWLEKARPSGAPRPTLKSMKRFIGKFVPTVDTAAEGAFKKCSI